MNTAAPNSTIRVWDLPVRLFHWLLVGSIALAFLSSEEDSALAGWHIAAGWVAAVLIAFRLVWGVLGNEHARFSSFVRPGKALSHLVNLAQGRAKRSLGHNPAGGIAVLLLIGTVIAVVATGWTALQGGEEDLHEGLAWLLLGLIGVHVAAVIATSILSRENLVRAMVTGRKKAADHPGAASARRAGPAAVLLAAAATAGAVVGIQSLDPLAFSLQPREGAERESGGSSEGEDARLGHEAGEGQGEEVGD